MEQELFDWSVVTSRRNKTKASLSLPGGGTQDEDSSGSHGLIRRGPCHQLTLGNNNPVYNRSKMILAPSPFSPACLCSADCRIPLSGLYLWLQFRSFYPSCLSLNFRFFSHDLLMCSSFQQN
jgi:hypothetical protein